MHVKRLLSITFQLAIKELKNKAAYKIIAQETYTNGINAGEKTNSDDLRADPNISENYLDKINDSVRIKLVTVNFQSEIKHKEK